MSRAGKTSLANYLKWILEARNLSVRIFQQDEYVHKKEEIPKIKEMTDWERPESIDFDRFKKAIKTASEKYDVVIAEGLLCFYDYHLNKMYDKRFFLDISKDEFVQRKKRDNRWGFEPNWYIKHIWESYKKYGKTILEGEFDYLPIHGSYPYPLHVIKQYLEVLGVTS